MGESIVDISGLSKRYQRGKHRVDVLSDLALQVDAGDFIALMGPSGSGKSTLLNLMGGLDTPTAGSVTVAGQRIDQLGSGALAKWRAHHVGYVFQFYNLMPNLSALKNVELPLLLHKMSGKERQRRAMVALNIVDLADRAKHRPAELSGGQQQRVAIARALVTDPTLIICDEPTGDLDRQSADDILSLLSILNKEHGKTIIMVTHDPKAAGYANKTLHLDKGQLVDEEAA
ncbi:MAG: ABC transporter ATP-binding protein [Xanthomonadales bacterium]|nr:ABC transporter ATP-binding protein [Xanthomonadales bacterium]